MPLNSVRAGALPQTPEFIAFLPGSAQIRKEDQRIRPLIPASGLALGSFSNVALPSGQLVRSVSQNAKFNPKTSFKIPLHGSALIDHQCRSGGHSAEIAAHLSS